MMTVLFLLTILMAAAVALAAPARRPHRVTARPPRA